MTGTWAASKCSEDKFRDSSFIRLELLEIHRVNGIDQDVPTCTYAQLHYIIHVVLPAHEDFGIKRPFETLLAFVSPCRAGGDATRSLVTYEQFKRSTYVHVGTIQCIVGRVRVGRGWGIIDTSVHCSRTAFFTGDDDENLSD